MDITMTRSTPTTSSSRVGMSACGHAFAMDRGVDNAQILGGVVRDRARADKGQLAIVPAYTRGAPAWRPPLS